MDISKKYIKMCKASKEIQKLWKPKTGDSFSSWPLWNEKLFGCDYNNLRMNSMIWLPRQDQLQEMIKRPQDKTMGRFYTWYINNYFNSFEKGWFSYVMKENYGKVWNKNEWIIL